MTDQQLIIFKRHLQCAGVRVLDVMETQTVNGTTQVQAKFLFRTEIKYATVQWTWDSIPPFDDICRQYSLRLINWLEEHGGDYKRREA